MHSVFIYEYFTGGGTLSDRASSAPSGSLLREGTAMVRALADDFQALGNVQVWLMQDGRLGDLGLPGCRIRAVHGAEEERAAFRQLGSRADATLLIAPEFDGHLLRRCRWAESASHRLLSPSTAFVGIASDKHHTADCLRRHGVPVAPAVTLEPNQPLPQDFAYPAVLKPRDGAGSMGLRLISGPAAEPATAERPARLEAFCQGMPASVAILCGPAGNVALPACRQRISRDGRFRYLGGRTPLAEPWGARAKALALAAVACLPPAIGYVGVDLVLGDGSQKGRDVVIEINPRLTTSYVGLRHLARTNLAAAMMAVAQGHIPELSFSDQLVQFEADGRIGR